MARRPYRPEYPRVGEIKCGRCAGVLYEVLRGKWQAGEALHDAKGIPPQGMVLACRCGALTKADLTNGKAETEAM